jgi:hypothetical protein
LKRCDARKYARVSLAGGLGAEVELHHAVAREHQSRAFRRYPTRML